MGIELAHVFKTVREPLLVLDGNTLQVKLANPAFYETFHVGPTETKNRPVFELGNGQWNIPSLRKQLQQVLFSEESLSNFEVEHDFEGIGIRTMRLNVGKIGNGRLILLAIEDITDRKQMEKELMRSNRELQEFAHITSHDLKEPLRMVKSYLRLLERHLGRADNRVVELIHFATDGAERMDVLIENLLAYSTIGKQRRLGPVNLNE